MTHESEAVVKRPYEGPVLTTYGSIEDLTQNAGAINSDGLSGSK